MTTTLEEVPTLLGRLRLQPQDGSTRSQPTRRDELPPELLAQIHDKSVLDNGLPYLNSAWASTDLVDTYSTRMLPSTLKNYAADATAGIAIQNSHRVDEQSLGRTYRGTFKNGKPAAAVMDFYIPPGLNVNGTSTDHIIDGIKWGTVKDVSVGFYGGEMNCSMCHKPMFQDLAALFGLTDETAGSDPNAPCPHLPGVEYPVYRDGKKTADRAVAIGEIDGAHCAELSFVFDGATPGAEINGRQAPALAKALRMAELDVLSPHAALALERRWPKVRSALRDCAPRGGVPGFRATSASEGRPPATPRAVARKAPAVTYSGVAVPARAFRA
jgi:hypothetical protein